MSLEGREKDDGGGGGGTVTAIALVELKVSVSHVAVLYLLCLSTILHFHVQPRLGSTRVIQRSVF